MKTNVKSITIYKSELSILCEEGGERFHHIIDFDTFRLEHRKLRESEAREALLIKADFSDEALDKIIEKLYTCDVIIADNKITLYHIRCYEAYSAGEKGIYWCTHKHRDTMYYKHEILEEREVELPKGYTWSDEDDAYYPVIYDSDGDQATLVRERDGSVVLVSKNGITPWFKS